ncbi:hypothetical protein ACFW17_21890 [Streptomyces sp. NPDC058961]|uniref:hypothetical protein n=1 Tax=Streptomyces sp. NPDC058961 TaxID=3346680 RepID=UPI0036B32AC2
MTRMPRVICPSCGDTYAAHPTQGLGMVAVFDHKRESRALVLCPGSMVRVPLAGALAWQDILPDPEKQAERIVEQASLF